MGNRAAPVFGLVIEINGLFPQQLRNFLEGGFLLASQKQGAVTVTDDVQYCKVFLSDSQNQIKELQESLLYIIA